MALVAAGCGGGDPEVADTSTSAPTTTVSEGTTTSAPATTATTPAPENETTTTTAAEVDLPAKVLTYGYQPDEVLVYELSLQQQLDVTADGDPGAFGEEDLPLEVDLDQRIDTVMTYAVAEGPEPGTRELTITAEFSDLQISGTANGEPFDPNEDTFEFDVLEPVNATVVVDESGRVLSLTTPDGETIPLGDVGGLQSFGTDQLGRPLGPVFPDGQVEVGDTWTEEESVEGPAGEPLVTRSSHSVVAAEVLDGHEVLVIESEFESDGFEFDLAELFAAFFAGFGEMAEEMGGEGSDDVQDELDQMLADFEFLIIAEPATGTATTWFDPEAGIVRKAEQSNLVGIGMRFRGPDENTGELVSFRMDMSIDQDVAFELTGERS